MTRDEQVEIMAEAAHWSTTMMGSNSPIWAELHPDVQMTFRLMMSCALAALEAKGMCVVPWEHNQ